MKDSNKPSYLEKYKYWKWTLNDTINFHNTCSKIMFPFAIIGYSMYFAQSTMPFFVNYSPFIQKFLSICIGSFGGVVGGFIFSFTYPIVIPSILTIYFL